MDQLDPQLIDSIRQMARDGAAVSQMLRVIIHQLGPRMPDKITLVRYMREAFALSLRQANSLFGWAPDETGELEDGQIDCLVGRGIQENRNQWDSPRRSEGT